MHMADALISPAVGGTFWALSGGLIAWCARKLKQAADDRLVPMMGVLGAFIFAAQMINFTIPGTGSSGHLGGGLILAALLGPYAGFLVIASVLAVQALFFADGGLLALGCNIFNLGFFPAFIAYPLIYRPLTGSHPTSARIWTGSMLAAVIGLLLGALGVIGQTMASGITELSIATFTALMLPIHLAIGVVEGLASAVVISFVARARPAATARPAAASRLEPALVGLAVAALVTGMGASWFASTHPDGLEWSISRTTGSAELAGRSSPVHAQLASLQESTAFLPDYGFAAPEAEATAPGAETADAAEPWPSVSAGTSVSGLVGGLLTLAMAGGIGWMIRPGRRTATA